MELTEPVSFSRARRATAGKPADGAATTHSARAAVIVLAVCTTCAVALQIVYPLTRGAVRDRVTVAVVVAFALTCVAHALVTRGTRRAAAVLVVTAGLGYLVEVLGVHTGFPFGSYRYSAGFGPQWLAVPLIIALAWTMLCWPAALVARRLVAGPVARVLLGAWATAAGDLFLDPQMVSTGVWTWAHPDPHLPGTPGVPLSNYAGWLLVALVLSALVQVTMGDGDDTLGVGLYVWSWLAWTMALSVFLGLRAAALWGAVAMGTVAVPAAVSLGRQVRRRRQRDCAPLDGVVPLDAREPSGALRW